MIDELKLRKDAQRAAKADALLNDELLKEAFAELEAGYIETWKKGAKFGLEGRDRLWHAVQVVGSVQEHLQTIINNGRVAEEKLAQIAKEPKRKLFG